MKQCAGKCCEAAVVLNGNDVIKISNLKRKYDKIINNPNMKILEECNMDMLDEKYSYWNRTISKGESSEEDEVKTYHFKNPKTGYTITSIKPDLEHLKSCTKDWMDYVKLD